MNNDDVVRARAKMIALEAAKNLLISHYGPRNVARVLTAGIVEEIRRLAGDDNALRDRAIDAARMIIPED